LRGLETGELSDTEFERRFGGLIGVAEHDGLIARMFAGLRPDERMIGAVRAAREGGVPTGLISNSWGLGIYDRAPTDLFDATVISGEVGLHKPRSPRSTGLPASGSGSSPGSPCSSTICARTAPGPSGWG
jgi:putative hydrolase of the HAD superfamily